MIVTKSKRTSVRDILNKRILVVTLDHIPADQITERRLAETPCTEARRTYRRC